MTLFYQNIVSQEKSNLLVYNIAIMNENRVQISTK